MADKLTVLAGPAQRETWLRWAEQRVRWQGDPEAEGYLPHGVRLWSASGRTYRVWLPSGHIVPMPVAGSSRLFDDASSQYLENTVSAPATAAPLTMALWGNSDDATIQQTAFCIQDKDLTSAQFRLEFRGATAGDPIRYSAESLLAGVGSANSTTGYSANTWHHACGVEASTTSRTAYIDGGSAGTNTTAITPLVLDSISIGRRGISVPEGYFSGLLAEAAVWSAELAAGYVALLAKAISPILVVPQSLVFYCPVIGRYSPEIDLRGGRSMTVTGATVAAHTRIFNPIKARPFRNTAPAGSNQPPYMGTVAFGRRVWVANY